MGKIVLDNFNLGGLSDSPHAGARYTQPYIVGMDVHSKPGVMRVAQKMTKETSGTEPDEFCEVAIACSNGASYWFSKTSGKIWKRATDGTWSLIYTTSPGAGTAGCLGAYEFNGYIYWATSHRLHRITVANAATWASPDINWQTWTDTAAAYHPMIDVNGILYIGDGYQIDQVEGTTFSDSALDLPTEYDVTCLARVGTVLLIGTSIADNVNIARVFVWNTWSVSWSEDAVAPEAGVNAFLMLDNTILVSCGLAGNLYAFGGKTLDLYRKVPGDYNPSATGFIRPNAVANYRGSLVFGYHNLAGTPALPGTYVLGRHTNGYPMVLTLDYPISTGNLTTADIGKILVIGNDLFVSWYDPGQEAGFRYGVDKLDWTAKCTVAYMETVVMKPDRTEQTNFAEYEVDYDTMPSGAAVGLQYKRAEDSSYTALSMIQDTMRKKYTAELILSSPTLQLKYVPTVSGNNAPEIEDIVVRTQE